jgi:lysophospholipase
MGRNLFDLQTGLSPCPTFALWLRAARLTPDVLSVRRISYDESTWVESRLDPDRFFSYLSSINLTSANVHLNLSSTADSPVIGLAFSGGGYRAMVSGGGQLWATDPRNVEAVEAGIGGLLNVTTYVAGLSGGSWLLGSYFSYSNSSPPDLTALAVDWDLEENLVVPTEGPIDSLRYWTSLVDAVNAKAGAGYALQITDLWGNALGTHLFPERYTVTETPNLTMSDLSGLSGGGLPYVLLCM